MTTDRPSARPAVVIALRTAVGASLVCGVVVCVVAPLVGSDAGRGAALLGAAVGALTVVVFFTVGAAVLGAVARTAPEASVLVALVTYLVQVVAVGAVFLLLSRSGLLDSTISAGWLAAAVIAGTLTWMLAHIVGTVRLRIPAYEGAPERSEADAR